MSTRFINMKTKIDKLISLLNNQNTNCNRNNSISINQSELGFTRGHFIHFLSR